MRPMRNAFASLLFCATLPLAAGFAVSGASAQGLQYAGPGDAQGVSAGQHHGGAPVMGDMTKAAQLEQQIRDMTNQLEQRDFAIRQLQSQFDKYKADTEQRLKALEDRGASAPAVTDTSTPPVSAPMNADMGATPPNPAPLQNNPAATAPVTGGVTDPNGAYQPTNTPTLGQISEKTGNNGGAITSGTPQGTTNAPQAYDKAFSYLQQSNYTDAQTAFTDFLKTYPTHPLAANAQYWLGETYYAQTQYSTAAKTFAKAFQDHPNGQKAADALLKLAMTLDKMNKRADACLTLVELGKRFPAGPASTLRKAEEERQRMECKA